MSDSQTTVEKKEEVSSGFVESVQSEFGWFTMVILGVIGGVAVATVIVLLIGSFSQAANLATVASALSTLLLVVITGQYAVLTRRLVDENQRESRQRRERWETERTTKRRSLRKALLGEIQTVQYLDQLAEEYHPGRSLSGFIAPTIVYEANADQLGHLTPEEADAVVEFYTRVYQLEDSLRVQRELDTPYKKDAVMRYYKTFQRYLDEILRKGTFGRITPNHQERTERVRRMIKELDEARERAASELESEL